MMNSNYFVDASSRNALKIPQIFSYKSEDMIPDRMKWSKFQRKILRELSSTKNWEELSQLPAIQKSPMECYMQYRNIDDPSINHDPWDREGEKKLAHFAQVYNGHHWCEIAEKVNNGKTPLQCLQHYQVNLSNMCDYEI